MTTTGRPIEGPGLSQRLNREITGLLGLILLVFILGILTYNGPFRFWDHAISYFGRLHTQTGHANTLCFVFFTLGMLASSLVCFHISHLFKGTFHTYLFRACGAGYLFIIMPCDVCDPIHVVGGALVFGSLWLFAVTSLHELHRIHKYRFYLYQCILQGTVLPYALLYAIGSDAKQVAQKIALAGLIIVLKLVMLEHNRMSEKDF